MDIELRSKLTRWTSIARETGPFWYGGRQYSVLIDPSGQRVIGNYWHDGHGKWFISVFVSYWRAFNLIRRREGYFTGWARFPTCCIELYRQRDDMAARQSVEELSGVKMLTPEDLET